MEATVCYFLMLQKTYQSKVKDSEIKDYTLRLGNISKYFPIKNMKKVGLKGTLKRFCVDFNPIDTNDILVMHKYLMEKP